MNNEFFIQKTFELARLAQGRTWPNPLVGCVIVKNGKIIGEGYHHQAGLDHAEIDALKNCTESPEGATLYVNLEPCCHTKKQTPPCAQRLIQEKIRKVVICNLDPNPQVFGQGVELLRSHGMEVEHGILEKAGEELNEVFFLAQRKKRPFVHLKLAATLDGKTAMMSGESKWITGEKAREHVHLMRSQVQAVIVGAETIRKDDPELNVRLPNYTGPQPLKIIFTKSGKLPYGARALASDSTLIYSMSSLPLDFPTERVIQINSLGEAMEDLFQRKIVSVLLEGGSNLATSFLNENLVDRVSLFLNPSFLGEGVPLLGNLNLKELKDRPKLNDLHTSLIGSDILITGRP